MIRPFNNYPYQNLNDLNLDFVLSVAKEAQKTLEELSKYDDRLGNLEKAAESLKYSVEALENGKLTPEMEKAIIELISKNIVSLVGDMVKFVFFEITDDGYFCAYIPKPWDSIVFNTSDYDIKIENVDYGHLILSY